MSDPRSNEIKSSPSLDEAARKVTQRITDVGYYYRAGDMELGPFTVEQEQDPKFDDELASKLGVESKEILKARLVKSQRPTTFSEVAEVLASTIRKDQATKLILFSAMLLTFTDEDQINILMSGESAGGKSYNALEVAAYFPQDLILFIGRASPTSFFHDRGTWDDAAKVLRVDLSGKILILLDQPHYMLLQNLRALLSHDRREILHKITDPKDRKGLRTKNVILRGYPTVIFCAAKLSLDEQEATRVFMLSPETSQEKLEESLRLAIARVGDREGFKRWVESHPLRRLLKARAAAIRAADIKQVIVEDQEGVYRRFLASHPRLAPRHQRDLPRILSLIKAHALLNWCHRESPRHGMIVANQEDVEAGFWLYSLIAESNEHGLPPRVYEIYREIILPHLSEDMGLDRQTIIREYLRTYGRPLDPKKLREEILPDLEAAGLIVQREDPTDKRRTLMYPSDVSPISGEPSPERNRGSISRVPLYERRKAGIDWLSDPKNLDADRWAPLDRFTKVVGGLETVQHMLREGLIELHPTELNKVRLVRR